MFKRTSLALLVSVSFGASAGSVDLDPIVLDGHLGDNEGYSRFFSIDYKNSEDEGDVINGGTLAFGTKGDKQYVFISHPLGFKDLSYGEDDKYTVGWGATSEEGKEKKGKEKKGKGKSGSAHKDLDKAIGSEFIGLQLTSSNGDLYGISFNPSIKKGNQIGDDPDEKGEGTYDDVNGYETNGVVVKYLSTADYNQAQVTDYQGDVAEWFTKHSPQTVDCDDESSSDTACYSIDDTVAENYIDRTADGVDNPTLIKWDFRWGLEIELDLKGSNDLFFGDLADINLDAFGYQSDNSLISLQALHASPAKIESDCKKHEPCGATVVSSPRDNPTEVPEPSSLAIFSLALSGLWMRNRRSKK